jgi:excisionase family DNA binding protein
MPTKNQPERGKEPISWWARQMFEIVKLQAKVGEVMSMAEAAQYLEISRQRMTQICKSGRMRHWKVGRSGIVTKAEVVAYAKEVDSGMLIGGRGHKAKPVARK